MHMEKQSTSRRLDYCDLGFINYQDAWDLQKNVLNERLNNNIADTFFLLEHPHTYTLGKTADKENLIGSADYLKKNNIDVVEIDRGGDITYHGPGQIVGYPIINLKDWKMDTHLYLRSLEEVIILTCREFGLDCGRQEKYTGVWLNDRKIAAIGIKVSRWITMHGFAFNINTDLSFFNGIIPCGIKDKEVTSLEKELGRNIDLNETKQILVNNFIKVFEYSEFDRRESANYKLS